MKLTPEDVLALSEPTKGFMCPLSANLYGIDFQSFTINDYETKEVIFEINKKNACPDGMEIDLDSGVGLNEDCLRKIKYTFGQAVLQLPYIGTSLTFKTEKELPSFRMIERHYFDGVLIRSYDFEFGYCIPGSVNSWDAIYAVPPLEKELVKDMIRNPFATTSDSFYFVGDELVLHNKASYKYI